MRVVAVDWSGSSNPSEQRKRIWCATAQEAKVESLTSGRTRDETVEIIKEMAIEDRGFVVGLDFAFSFPRWFCRQHRLRSAYEVWDCVAVRGERWLEDCPIPFWGRRGTTRDTGRQLFRTTELRCPPVGGIRPKSVFQISGPGAVGAGSLRGMPILRDLHDEGFSIWPFDPPGWPMVVEIYPRALTGPVRKSGGTARRTYLAEVSLEDDVRDLAENSEDAFDAAVSAIVMSEREDDFRDLGEVSDATTEIEGAIWLPRVPTEEGCRGDGRNGRGRNTGRTN